MKRICFLLIFLFSSSFFFTGCTVNRWAGSSYKGQASKRSAPVKGNIRTKYKPRKGASSVNIN